MTHSELADLYRAADLAVWPRQESMSMLDAAASALPLIVSDAIGESDRVAGNGATYRENDLESLIASLQQLSAPELQLKFGNAGRQKMIEQFSWAQIAQSLMKDFVASRAGA